jgi:N6-L-threonylcarbamoyladenine synthase
MLILGIESSCDDTGVAIYDDKKGVLANCLHSQIETHKKYGGVVPELASRDHIRKLVILLQQALKIANVKKEQLDAVAYTQGPGLVGALLCGVAFAKSFSWGLNIPSIAINHLEGHIMAALLEDERVEFPAVVLLVSGGHTMLLKVQSFGKYELLGESCDDAAGEAFDKTAKLLGLPYPGGPHLSALAKKGVRTSIIFPRPMLNSNNLDFSFSGLKTAVLQYTQKQKNISDQERANIALAFEEAVVDVLVYKTIQAVKKTSVLNIVIGGGVGANDSLRWKLKKETEKINTRVFYPSLKYCTDNAAMIAFVGSLYFKDKNFDKNLSIFAKPRWSLK